jgi:hypothetical protein
VTRNELTIDDRRLIRFFRGLRPLDASGVSRLGVRCYVVTVSGACVEVDLYTPPRPASSAGPRAKSRSGDRRTPLEVPTIPSLRSLHALTMR